MARDVPQPGAPCAREGSTSGGSRAGRPAASGAPAASSARSWTPLPRAAPAFPAARQIPTATSPQAREGLCYDRVDHLADALDVALAAALDLEDATAAQRSGESWPEPVVVGDPVQRGRRDDHVDRLVEDQVQHVLAPDPSAIPQTRGGKVDHLLGGVDGQNGPVRTSSSSASVTRPVPHPTSSTFAPAGRRPATRSRTANAHSCCGPLARS